MKATRRGFLKGLLGAAVAATARVYALAPSASVAEPPQPELDPAPRVQPVLHDSRLQRAVDDVYGGRVTVEGFCDAFYAKSTPVGAPRFYRDVQSGF